MGQRGDRLRARGGFGVGAGRAGRVPVAVRAPARAARRPVWTARIESWLEARVGRTRWYPGRPLLITKNDYGLDLYNGDAGVVVARRRGRSRRRSSGAERPVAPSRLNTVETMYAMTVHKSQGSQFGTAACAAAADSQILTRELLYTAVTRADRHLILVGTEQTIRDAIGRPVARASGLGRRLA